MLSASRGPTFPMKRSRWATSTARLRSTTARQVDRAKSYMIQRINTYAFRQPVLVMENIDKVTEHIRAKRPDKVALHFHHTVERKKLCVPTRTVFWRLFNYVPSATYNTTDNLTVIRNAGEAFGEVSGAAE